jgi:hypothetical protein
VLIDVRQNSKKSKASKRKVAKYYEILHPYVYTPEIEEKLQIQLLFSLTVLSLLF